MTATTDAASLFQELDGKRQGLITRCQLYASFTIPKLCLPEGRGENDPSLKHDWQSVGAQAVNHLSNKLMITLFSPSRPFFRIDPSSALKAQLAEAKVETAEVNEALSDAEKAAVKELDQMGSRPTLYELIKHLMVTGNVLVKLSKEGIEAFGLKRYVVRRSHSGTLLDTILKSQVELQELDADAREQVIKELGPDPQVGPAQQLFLYEWVTRNEDGSYSMTQWVNKVKLEGSKYMGKYPALQNPYRPLTWDRASGDNYGTGLVEDYEGDFASLSALSEAQIQAAILASEFRWMVNPAGMTKVEDLQRSKNGDALPGSASDIQALEHGKAGDLGIIRTIGQDYIQRIGRGFLLNSAVTRDAERVTAEEIRIQAQELETALGGVYSRIAVDLQLPMALWLCTRIKMSLVGKAFEPVIITGLDALSRNGDMDVLKAFLGDLAAVGSLPPPLLATLKIEAIIAALAAGRGLKSKDYVKSQDEMQADQQQQQQAELNSQATQEGIRAGGQAAQQQPQQ